MLRPRRTPLTAALAASVLLLTAACGLGGDGGQPGPDAMASGPVAPVPVVTPAGAADVTWGGEACRITGVTCAEHAGLPTVLLPAASGGSRAVVLVDFGGPGGSVEQALDRVGDLGLPADLGVLLVGEAWEVSPPPETCLEQEATRLAHWSSVATAACDPAPWTFDPSAYRDAIAGALAPADATVAAAVGISFGAVRVSAATAPSVPLALLSPAPPSGTLSEVVGSRASAISAAAVRACGATPGCGPAVSRMGSAAVRDDAGYEAALALVGAAPSPEAFSATALSLATPDADSTRAALHRQAFAATFRYGDGEVLPNLVSYRGGLCGWYAPGTAPVGAIGDVLSGVLGCPAARGAAGATGSAPSDLRDRTGCVFTAKDDLVTPPAFSRAWTAAAPGLQPATASLTSHGSTDGAVADVLGGLPDSLRSCTR
ncbi:MAG: hypothetical protein ABIS35_13160 [Terracoccus sp.]